MPKPTPTNTVTPGSARPAADGDEVLKPRLTFDEVRSLEAERERLRRELETRFAERLRLTTASQGTGEGCEISPEEAVLASGIVHLSLLLEAAVVDEAEPEDDAATIGSTVRVEFADSGETRDFHLISGYERPGTDVASAGSPVGQALLGQRAGAKVAIELTPGRRRTLKILSVSAIPRG